MTYAECQVDKLPRCSFRIQTTLLSVVPRLDGNALYLANLNTYSRTMENGGYDVHND